MGTAVEKVQYIYGTKQVIKEALRKKGVKVADTDTFRSYAEKIESIGGGGAVASAAEYIFGNTLQTVAFPRKPSTEDTSYLFASESEYKESSLEFSCYEPNANVEGMSYFFDENLTTNGNMINGIFFKFDKPVTLEKLYVYSSGGYEVTLKGTNNPEIATNAYSDLWNELYTGGAENYNVELNPTQAYQYYCLTKNSGYKTIYELKLYVIVGDVSCTLKSTNMTPTIKAFPKDYMQVVTQDWYPGQTLLIKPFQSGGSEIIPSQTLTFKPYADGGCLIGYIDDGKAVNLKMFYAKSNGQIVSKHWAQPILDSNGTLGGEFFAVYSDHEENSESAIYKAFDGNESTVWKSGSSSTPVNIIFYNPTPINVSNIHIKFINGEVYSSGDIYGSNDNNDYSLVGSFSNNSQDEIDVATNGNYKYFKIELTALYSGWGHIAEITITATEDGIKKDTYFISTDDITPPSGYESVTKVADLNIPAHIYFNGTDWVMGK